jgi:hypothetical protein
MYANRDTTAAPVAGADGLVRSSGKDKQVLRRSGVRPHGATLASNMRRPWGGIASVAAVCLAAAGVALAPPTLADPAPNIRDAVASLRGGTSCGPLRYDPVVEQAAEIINRLEDDYISHAARQQPIDDPTPGLKDLGYGGKKAKLLRGTARNDADAITAMLLQGYNAFSDCSYGDFGVSILRNAETGYTSTAVVLAGA